MTPKNPELQNRETAPRWLLALLLLWVAIVYVDYYVFIFHHPFIQSRTSATLKSQR